MAILGKRETIRLASLIMGGAVFSLCSWMLGNTAIQNVLTADAKATADEWGDYLSASIPEIGTIVGGGQASASTQDFLRKTQTIGAVFRYRLYNPAGSLVLDSLTKAEKGDDREDAEAAKQVSQTGLSILKASSGDGLTLPRYYAEAYLPSTAVRGVPSRSM